MNKRKLLTIVLTMVCSIFLYSSVLGQTPTKRIDIAEMSNNGANVSWFIKVPYESATLTVSTPSGEVYRKEFRAGSIPTFSPTTERGEYYGDGKFTYQIVLTPILSPSVKEALAQSRIDGNSDEVRLDFVRRGMIPAEMVETGTFTIRNGGIVTGDNNLVNEPETRRAPRTDEPRVDTKTPPVATPDAARGDEPVDNLTVIPMDLVVQGSECLGLDCPTNPNFGFSTLILQENNLRITFTDTSNTASFPTTDWEIKINDTTNGGQDFFRVSDITNNKDPFTIEGNAATNSLYVDSTSRIGFKTATPVVELHVRDGDSPTLRLEQDGSSGFQAQTWDIAGNEANFFIRDATNGSRLVFKIKPGAPTSSIFVQNNGRIGLGTESPSRRLDVNGDLRFRSGVLEFPDGTTQGTAATGSGISFLDSIYSQTVFGGQGVYNSISTIPEARDFNFFSISTNGQNGFASYLINVPSNINLANQAASNIVYVIRYRDEDGVGTNALVRVDVVGVAQSGGGRATQLVFDSNTNAATVNNTVTICQANSTSYFNYSARSTHLAVTVQGNGTSNAELFQIQMYKTNSCPP